MQLNENMQKVSENFGNAITVRIQKRMMRAYLNIKTENIKESVRKIQKRKDGICGRLLLFQDFLAVSDRGFYRRSCGDAFLPLFHGAMDEQKQRGLWSIQYCMGTWLCDVHGIAL